MSTSIDLEASQAFERSEQLLLQCYQQLESVMDTIVAETGRLDETWKSLMAKKELCCPQVCDRVRAIKTLGIARAQEQPVPAIVLTRSQ
jgi:hypothetical protein